MSLGDRGANTVVALHEFVQKKTRVSTSKSLSWSYERSKSNHSYFTATVRCLGITATGSEFLGKKAAQHDAAEVALRILQGTNKEPQLTSTPSASSQSLSTQYTSFDSCTAAQDSIGQGVCPQLPCTSVVPSDHTSSCQNTVPSAATTASEAFSATRLPAAPLSIPFSTPSCFKSPDARFLPLPSFPVGAALSSQANGASNPAAAASENRVRPGIDGIQEDPYHSLSARSQLQNNDTSTCIPSSTTTLPPRSDVIEAATQPLCDNEEVDPVSGESIDWPSRIRQKLGLGSTFTTYVAALTEYCQSFWRVTQCCVHWTIDPQSLGKVTFYTAALRLELNERTSATAKAHPQLSCSMTANGTLCNGKAAAKEDAALKALKWFCRVDPASKQSHTPDRLPPASTGPLHSATTDLAAVTAAPTNAVARPGILDVQPTGCHVAAFNELIHKTLRVSGPVAVQRSYRSEKKPFRMICTFLFSPAYLKLNPSLPPAILSQVHLDNFTLSGDWALSKRPAEASAALMALLNFQLGNLEADAKARCIMVNGPLASYAEIGSALGLNVDTGGHHFDPTSKQNGHTNDKKRKRSMDMNPQGDLNLPTSTSGITPSKQHCKGRPAGPIIADFTSSITLGIEENKALNSLLQRVREAFFDAFLQSVDPSYGFGSRKDILEARVGVHRLPDVPQGILFEIARNCSTNNCNGEAQMTSNGIAPSLDVQFLRGLNWRLSITGLGQTLIFDKPWHALVMASMKSRSDTNTKAGMVSVAQSKDCLECEGARQQGRMFSKQPAETLTLLRDRLDKMRI